MTVAQTRASRFCKRIPTLKVSLDSVSRWNKLFDLNVLWLRAKICSKIIKTPLKRQLQSCHRKYIQRENCNVIFKFNFRFYVNQSFRSCVLNRISVKKKKISSNFFMRTYTYSFRWPFDFLWCSAIIAEAFLRNVSRFFQKKKNYQKVTNYGKMHCSKLIFNKIKFVSVETPKVIIRKIRSFHKIYKLHSKILK